MNVFDGLVGQEAVRRQLERAVKDAGSAMSHAWLFTGPPGSGRSQAARMFAAALQCAGERPGCGECAECRATLAGGHPDVELVSASGVTMAIEQVREVVSRSFDAPGTGRWRIVIVEDADRMAENTTNVLLKALEEPPPSTVWMLCTTSPDDVLPTIRSRCRHAALVVPPAEKVAELLVGEGGVEPERALAVAYASQSHIGRARGLVRDAGAWEDRRAVLSLALGLRTTSDAVAAAARVLEILEVSREREAERLANQAEALEAAQRAAEARGADLARGGTGAKGVKKPGKPGRATSKKKSSVEDARLDELLRSLGLEAGEKVPRGFQKIVADFRKELERQGKRVERDGIDRVMIDLLSLYRDFLIVQYSAQVPLVNSDFEEEIRAAATKSGPDQSLRRVEAISLARERLRGNVTPLLALEAMMVSLLPSR